MKTFLVLVFCLITTFAVAGEKYTGRAEDIRQNERGIAFTVVIEDSQGKELLRRDQWVSAGVMQAIDLKGAIKNIVDRMTQEIWAHTENSEDFMTNYKTEVEVYRATCNSFVVPENRPNPQDMRP
jgi:hypothetical protein